MSSNAALTLLEADSSRADAEGASLHAAEESARDFLGGLGFEIIPPDGLLSPAFPDSFVPSAFHTRVVSGARSGAGTGKVIRQAGCEWVYRHIDQSKIGFSPFHLSAFKMLVFFSVHPKGVEDREARRETIRNFPLLLRHFGLAPEKCLITYFGGGSVRGQEFSPDREVVELWAEAGVSERNLIPVTGGANFTNLTRAGEPAGPRCEIFYPTGAGKFVELGTVVFERYLLKSGDAGFDPGEGLVYGAALGLERLSMTAGGRSEVFAVPELERLVLTVREEVDPRLAAVCSESILTLIDAARTLTVLWDATGGGCHGRRLDRMRSLWKSLQRSLQPLGVGREKALVLKLAEVVLRGELGEKEIELTKLEQFFSALEAK